MSDNQLAAYTSLAFNLGIRAFCNSSVARYHNAVKSAAETCARIKLFVYAGGKVLRGLVTRREAEYKLCMQPSETTTPVAVEAFA
jgi:lysozyme